MEFVELRQLSVQSGISFHERPEPALHSTTSASVFNSGRWSRVFLCGCISFTGLFYSRLSEAEESPESVSTRCRALRAEARSTAAVLTLPHVDLQAVRLPQNSDLTGENLTPGTGFQARIGAGLSAIDILRGQSVVATADAECDQWLAREALEEVLLQGTTFGQLEALRAQITAMDAGLPRIRQLVEESRQRFAREIVTIIEVDEIIIRELRYEGRLAELRHELVLLESQLPSHDGKPLEQTLQRYENASLAVEREHSRLRQLSAWKLDFQVGAIPYPQKDWFGLVTLGYHLGGFRQRSEEREAESARREELRTGSSELRSKVQRFVTAMRESVARLNEERLIIERQLAVYRERLAGPRPDSEKLRQVLAAMEIDQFELQAQQTYVDRLLEVRTRIGRTLE
jgi:hypothetical protein